MLTPALPMNLQVTILISRKKRALITVNLMLKTAEEEKMEFKKDLVLDKSPFLKFESISF